MKGNLLTCLLRDFFVGSRVALGTCATKLGVKQAAQLHNVSYGVAFYWRHKVLEPDFHASAWGGLRYGLFFNLNYVS